MSTESWTSVIPSRLAMSLWKNLMPSMYWSTVKSGKTAIIMSVADSRSVPDGTPSGLSGSPTVPGILSMTPPIGSGVVPLMPASVKAAEFTHRLWCPSDHRATGRSLTALSRSDLSGPMPGNSASLPVAWITRAGGLAVAKALTASR